jgi:hypothetical protein
VFDFCMWMGVQEIDIARSVCGGAFDGKGLFGSNEACSLSMEPGSAEGGDSNNGIHNSGAMFDSHENDLRKSGILVTIS